MTEAMANTHVEDFAAVDQYAAQVREHGARTSEAADKAAYAWSGLANRLDKMVRTLPPVPASTYLGSDGDPCTLDLLVGVDAADTVTELLADAIGRMDALAAELRRHAHLVQWRTEGALRELGVQP